MTVTITESGITGPEAVRVFQATVIGSPPMPIRSRTTARPGLL